MRDWKKAFGQPDEKFEFRIQQTLLSIEESEEKPVKRKLSLSMALCAALAVTILVVGAFAAGTRVGGIRDDRQPLAPGSQSTASAVAAYPTPMPTVVPDAAIPPQDFGEETSPLSPTLTPMAVPGNAVEYTTVWTDLPQSLYFHTRPDCEQLSGGSAEQLSLIRALKAGLTLCEECGARDYSAGGVNRVVVAAIEGDTLFYHFDAACALLPGCPQKCPATLNEALQMGATACPECGGADIMCAIAGQNRFYHDPDRDCPLISGQIMGIVPVAQALIRGYDACPICDWLQLEPISQHLSLEEEDPFCWITDGGTFYHIEADCSGMTGAYPTVLQDAREQGKKACPICFGQDRAAMLNGETAPGDEEKG